MKTAYTSWTFLLVGCIASAISASNTFSATHVPLEKDAIVELSLLSDKGSPVCYVYSVRNKCISFGNVFIVDRVVSIDSIHDNYPIAQLSYVDTFFEKQFLGTLRVDIMSCLFYNNATCAFDVEVSEDFNPGFDYDFDKGKMSIVLTCPYDSDCTKLRAAVIMSLLPPTTSSSSTTTSTTVNPTTTSSKKTVSSVVTTTPTLVPVTLTDGSPTPAMENDTAVQGSKTNQGHGSSDEDGNSMAVGIASGAGAILCVALVIGVAVFLRQKLKGKKTFADAFDCDSTDSFPPTAAVRSFVPPPPPNVNEQSVTSYLTPVEKDQPEYSTISELDFDGCVLNGDQQVMYDISYTPHDDEDGVREAPFYDNCQPLEQVEDPPLYDMPNPATVV